MKLFRRYPLELLVAALFVASSLIGVSLAHRPALVAAADSSAAAAAAATSEPANHAPSLSAASLLERSGRVRFSLDSVRYGGRESIVVSQAHPSVAIAHGEAVAVKGWAYDPAGLQPAAGVLVQVDDASRIAARYGAERADVARAFGVSGNALGFEATVPSLALAPGRHRLSFLVIDASGAKFYWLPDRLRVEVAR